MTRCICHDGAALSRWGRTHRSPQSAVGLAVTLQRQQQLRGMCPYYLQTAQSHFGILWTDYLADLPSPVCPRSSISLRRGVEPEVNVRLSARVASRYNVASNSSDEITLHAWTVDHDCEDIALTALPQREWRLHGGSTRTAAQQLLQLQRDHTPDPLLQPAVTAPCLADISPTVCVPSLRVLSFCCNKPV